MYIIASLLVILFKLDHLWLALFLYLLGMVVLIGGYFIPPLFNAFEKFGKMLGRSVGAGMTYALLVPFFYLCFLPGRLILNARGKDPMRRRWNPESKTYWIDKPKDEDAGRYTRQY
jgi:hypothetical protein